MTRDKSRDIYPTPRNSNRQQNSSDTTVETVFRPQDAFYSSHKQLYHDIKMSAREDDVMELKRRVQEGEEALQKAGQYGLQLLEDKMDLHNKMEEQRKEMCNVIEVLEQEKYSLQKEAELKCRLLESLRTEYDLVKSQQTHLLEQQQSLMERNHAREMSESRNQMEKIKADLEESQLARKQMSHKLEQQADALNGRTEELRALTQREHETMSSEILEMQMQKMDMESAMASMEKDLQEAQYKEEQMNLANATLQRKVERLTEEKEEREHEAVSCYNALEKAREANQDLQIQLEQVLQQAQDPNSKGNSLFSEVEDKRAEMERQLRSMKRQHESLQKQYTLTKQHMIRMKMQIASLMQLHGNRADPALDRLRFMISEKNSELEALTIKVRELEKEKLTMKDHLSPATSTEKEPEDGSYYTELLKIKLAKSNKDADKLKDELSLARMKSLSESQRVVELERKLYGAEQGLKIRHSEIIKLQVKVDELQMKYAPNEVRTTQVQKRRREKLPVDVLEEGTVPRETEVQKSAEEKTEAVAEKPSVIPMQSTQNTESSVTPPEGKSVKISEDPPVTIADSDWCSSNSPAKRSQEDESWRHERKRKIYSQPIRVSSQKTMAEECAQQ